MKSVIITNTYFYRLDPKQWRTGQPYPPYATLIAAAALQEKYEVIFHDNCLELSPTPLIEKLDAVRPDYLVIFDDGFNYLTKMCLTVMREAAFEMIRAAKSRGITTFISSSDSTDHFDRYLSEGADYVLLGEAELTLRETLDRLTRNEPTDDVRGLASRKDNQIFKTDRRPVVTDLDTLPDPAWSLVDLEPYREIWRRKNGYFSLNLATTRGCPFKCNWCAKPIYGNRYNVRSPQKVVDEIEYLQANFGVDHFWFCDDIFGLKPGWVQTFRDLIHARNIFIKYKIQSRVDLLLKENTIDALVDSGATTIWVGAESGSQKVLDAMDKGTTIEQIHHATRLLKRKGVEVCFFLQFGYLGETKEDILKTLELVGDLMPDDIGVSISYPLPDTRFHNKVKSLMTEKQNWRDSDDLAMMYRGTFSPAYYRRLHRYVHKFFQTRKILSTPLNETGLLRAMLLFYYAPMALVDRLRLKL